MCHYLLSFALARSTWSPKSSKPLDATTMRNCLTPLTDRFNSRFLSLRVTIVEAGDRLKWIVHAGAGDGRNYKVGGGHFQLGGHQDILIDVEHFAQAWGRFRSWGAQKVHPEGQCGVHVALALFAANLIRE